MDGVAKHHLDADVIIVGAGLAGLSVALTLAELDSERRIAIVMKESAAQCASDRAQGGISAVMDAADSIDAHIDDTLKAGAGSCDEAAVRDIVGQGANAIAWLVEQGVDFTRDATADCGFHLTREGGHGHRRVVHAADATGHAVLSALIEQLGRHANITLFEGYQAIDILHAPTTDKRGRQCHGIHVLDVKRRCVLTLSARDVVLATGGAGQVYPHTSNPEGSTGDGIAMAWRAGCRIANMEFVQFHPTCLYHPAAKSFLISEALRGEGAHLILPNGHRFMPDYDERAELAPRDIVARAIDTELKRHSIDCVYLDISHQPEAFLREHFPTILARCATFGIDITREAIPVVPAAHYTCGGIVTDTAGRSDLPGLYAVGEAACTGLHGANRLASNSLLECIVVGRAAARAMAAKGISHLEKNEDAATQADANASIALSDKALQPRPSLPVIEKKRRELQALMWQYVSIVRTDAGLQLAAERLTAWQAMLGDFDMAVETDRDATDIAWLNLRNLLDSAMLIVTGASQRRESRGAHCNSDWPNLFAKPLPAVQVRA